MSRKKKVAVLTVAFNRIETLDICLEALAKSQPAGVCDLFVIDNASTDPVKPTASKHGARYYRLDKNYFVARALNEGFKHFNILKNYDYVVFMGSDVLCDKFMIRDMTTMMDKTPEVGKTGPSHFEIHTDMLLTIGLSIHRVTSLLVNFLDADIREGMNHFHSLYFVRTEAFEKSGRFDHVLYPMIYEEPDLGERILKAGYKIKSTPEAKIWHPIEPKTKKYRIRKERLYNSLPKAYLFFRNRIIYMSTYSNPLQFLLFYFIINPVISLYYLPNIEKRFIWHAFLGWWHGTVFALTRNRKYIEARNKSLLNI